jgi:hypothetical protein
MPADRPADSAASRPRSYDVTELVAFEEQPDGSVRVEPKSEPEMCGLGWTLFCRQPGCMIGMCRGRIVEPNRG